MKKTKVIIVGLLSVVYVIAMIFISYIYTESPVYCKAEQKEYVINKSEENKISVYVKNRVLKEVSSEKLFFISYHLYDSNKKQIVFDNIRTDIAEPLSKGSKVNQFLNIAPLEAGEYYIILDIVQEGVRWYTPKHAIKSYVKIIVK